jgi:hypothetical protein
MLLLLVQPLCVVREGAHLEQLVVVGFPLHPLLCNAPIQLECQRTQQSSETA